MPSNQLVDLHDEGHALCVGDSMVARRPPQLRRWIPRSRHWLKVDISYSADDVGDSARQDERESVCPLYQSTSGTEPLPVLLFAAKAVVKFRLDYG
jgi:hypothetical protein